MADADGTGNAVANAVEVTLLSGGKRQSHNAIFAHSGNQGLLVQYSTFG